MNKKKLAILVGARPNFMKISQFPKLARKYNYELDIIHSGQHYDFNLSDVFFQELDLIPNHFLGVGSTTAISQISEIMSNLENHFLTKGIPDLLIVPGDVNTTLAGAIVANKLGVKLAHLESGLRSFDYSMPEEHNRIVVDNLSDYLFVSENSGIENIKNERARGQVFYVGNTMIDTLVHFEDKIEKSNILNLLELTPQEFITVTIHRPSNVDSINSLEKVISLIMKLSDNLEIVFPMHPRTFNKIKDFNLLEKINNIKNLKIIEPLGYFDFQKLIKNSEFVITDSGGIQEETTFRRIPCLTLRENTERPSTIIEGTNSLIPFDFDIINKNVMQIQSGDYKKGVIPKNWDGASTHRIFEILNSIL